MGAKSGKSTKASMDDLEEFTVGIVLLIILLLGNSNLGAMWEDIQAEGGIRGRRILEDKEDIKALFVSLLEEKLDLDEY